MKQVTGFWGLAALVVSGIVIADALIHPTGVQAAGTAVSNITTPSEAALLGTSPSSPSSATFPTSKAA